MITEKAAQTTIHLLMQGANALDSGVYECFPDNAPPAKIKVHILTAGNILENGNIKKTFTLRAPLLHNFSFSANCTVNHYVQ